MAKRSKKGKKAKKAPSTAWLDKVIDYLVEQGFDNPKDEPTEAGDGWWRINVTFQDEDGNLPAIVFVKESGETWIVDMSDDSSDACVADSLEDAVDLYLEGEANANGTPFSQPSDDEGGEEDSEPEDNGYPSPEDIAAMNSKEIRALVEELAEEGLEIDMPKRLGHKVLQRIKNGIIEFLQGEDEEPKAEAKEDEPQEEVSEPADEPKETADNAALRLIQASRTAFMVQGILDAAVDLDRISDGIREAKYPGDMQDEVDVLVESLDEIVACLEEANKDGALDNALEVFATAYDGLHDTVKALLNGDE